VARFLISWSTRAWHSQEVEADSYSEAGEKWDADGPRETYQENITDDWWEVECLDGDTCPDDDRFGDEE
jgi:hypothetical protein